MSSLESRLKRLEAAVPSRQIVIRVERQGETLAPAEEAVLFEEEQRRIARGEHLVFSIWNRKRARELGAPAPEPEAKKSGRCLVIMRPNGEVVRL